MKLDLALAVAEGVQAKLVSHCDRIEIAGSVRRRKPSVGDIEIVAIPRLETIRDLLGEPLTTRDRGFVREVTRLGQVAKGNPIDGRYVQVDLHGKITLDLFLATPENWGLIFAIRTGSADFSRHVLARGWVRGGYNSVDGMLMRNGVAVPMPEERDLFRVARVEWVEPENREMRAI